MKKSPSQSRPGFIVSSPYALPGAKVIFEPNSAPQRKVLLSLADEILCAGSKGGGKSYVMSAKMVSGNPDRPDEEGPFYWDFQGLDPEGRPLIVPHGSVPGAYPLSVNSSYVFHPAYFGVVVRRNQQDLDEWIAQTAKPFYESGPFYGVFRSSPAPGRFDFPYGSRIAFGHLKDRDSYMQYQGTPQLHRFYVDEGGQIHEDSLWSEIRSCLRSTYPELRCMLLISANPGGPGQVYLKNRFLRPVDPVTRELLINPATGAPYQAEETIIEEVHNPKTGEFVEKRTRVWIPSYTSDNPALPASYHANLLSLDEKQRRLYYFGDWDAYSGCYFDNYTERHVIETDPPWWAYKWGAMDWGFSHESVFLVGTQLPDTKQWLVLDELWTSRMDPEELGLEIGRRVSQHIPLQRPYPFLLFLSHDAFSHKVGTLTLAEMLKTGIDRILGSNATYIPHLLLEEMRERAVNNGEVWDRKLEDYQLYRSGSYVTLIRHQPARVAEAQWVRSLFREKELLPAPRLDWDVLVKICLQDGAEGYERYLRLLNSQQDSAVYPRLLIHRRCLRLRDAIPRAIHDESNPEDISRRHFTGMDGIDALKYLCYGLRKWREQAPPLAVRAQQLFEELSSQGASMNSIVVAQQYLQQEYDKENSLLPLSRARRNSLYPGGEWG